MTTWEKMKKTFLGTPAFYKMVLAIVIPIIIQNAITNFVNLLDNIMVGLVGTEEMTGVSIVNQLMFVSNLCVFGGVSGAGIFAAQYHGANNSKGVRDCLRFKLYLCSALTVIALGIFLIGGTQLIQLYLNENQATERIAETLAYGQQYLKVMLWGIAPFAISQAYSSTLRETGETALPMRAGLIAVFVNVVLNYILIYGKLNIPPMGVYGAALATVISRYVELLIILVFTHRHVEKYHFAQGVYSSGRVPMELVKKIAIKGFPLLVNEALWALGMAALTRCYSLRGLDVVAALNISNTVSNLFNVVFLSMGSAIAILIGQELGAGDVCTAKSHAWQLTAFTVASCLVTAALLAIAAPFIPLIYKANDVVRGLATRFMLVGAGCMPLFAFANASYFILRSGGKTLITFLFDCVFEWIISLPIAYMLAQFTQMDIIAVYLCVQLATFVKCVIGAILVKKEIWIQKIVV